MAYLTVELVDLEPQLLVLVQVLLKLVLLRTVSVRVQSFTLKKADLVTN